MTDVQERRDPATERVKVATLVEICGNIPGIPVFEAESVDVSPRGMHLRTAYLPEAGAPLVCRFESEGREIVVEGTVAWRREGSRGGEFGVAFTALDSRSVDALRGLCGATDVPASKSESQSQLNEPGARVRLHIEGLGSPMKARVKSGGSSAKLQVGSSLEFLKVGRRLEIEDLDLGARRPAEIDTVSVIVDPSTQVPQLVVGLRFEDSDEATPSPSVAPVGKADAASAGLRIPASRVSTDARPAKAEPAKAASDESDEDEPEMRGRVASIAASAEKKAKVASEHLAHASNAAARGAASWLKSAAEKVMELKQRRAAPPRRTTSPTKSALSTEKPRLRPQNNAASASANDEAPTRRWSRRTVAIAGGGSVVAIAALAFALRGPSSPPPGAKAGAEIASETVAANGATATGAAVAPTHPSLGPKGAVTANVPLFGPTPLTTTEPAPLGPPPGSEAASLEASEKADARASVSHGADLAFAEEAGEGTARGGGERDSDDKLASKPSVRPEDVAPWGHGRVREPTIHRLRLDGPGAKIAGTVEPTGFTIVVPSRKVMEAAGPIAKRDARIARVRASNTAAGAQVSFRFKDSVPSYRVRLRRDYVEFLISEPTAEKDTKLASSTKKKPAR